MVTGRSQSSKQVTEEPTRKKPKPKGLYANIHAKQARGETMRKKGDKGAPAKGAFARAALTAKKPKRRA